MKPVSIADNCVDRALDSVTIPICDVVVSLDVVFVTPHIVDASLANIGVSLDGVPGSIDDVAVSFEVVLISPQPVGGTKDNIIWDSWANILATGSESEHPLSVRATEKEGS